MTIKFYLIDIFLIRSIRFGNIFPKDSLLPIDFHFHKRLSKRNFPTFSHQLQHFYHPPSIRSPRNSETLEGGPNCLICIGRSTSPWSLKFSVLGGSIFFQIATISLMQIWRSIISPICMVIDNGPYIICKQFVKEAIRFFNTWI